MKYYSVLKRSKSSNDEKTKNLNSFNLSERKQSEKAIDCMSSIVGHSGKSKTITIVKISMAARVC